MTKDELMAMEIVQKLECDFTFDGRESLEAGEQKAVRLILEAFAAIRADQARRWDYGAGWGEGDPLAEGYVFGYNSAILEVAAEIERCAGLK